MGADQLIAITGDGGQSTGSPGRFEAWLGGSTVDPLPWLRRRGISI